MVNFFMTSILNFFADQGPIANLVTIFTPVIAVLLFIRKKIFNFVSYIKSKKYYKLMSWSNSVKSKYKSPKDLKIAILDDELEDYPIDSLVRLGYSIQGIRNIDISQIGSLKNFDCIMLDIHGVLKENDDAGGYYILEKLKADRYPYIIAVSSKGFDITMSKYFMLADDRLKKPIPKEVVEDYIKIAYEQKFSISHAAKRVDEILDQYSDVDNNMRASFNSKIIKYISGNLTRKELVNALCKKVHGVNLDDVLIESEIIKKIVQ